MNKYSSVFSQILSLFSRLEFEKLVDKTGAERGKGIYELITILWHY